MLHGALGVGAGARGNILDRDGAAGGDSDRAVVRSGTATHRPSDMRAEKDMERPPSPPRSRLLTFWRNPIGKKALMAVTGIVLFVYVLVHMLANLQLFAGPGPLDRYARLLHGSMALLWTARAILILCVVVHVVAGVQLWLQKRSARPMGYGDYQPVVSTPASRTMIWSGILILGFVVYHLLDLTVGVANPSFEEARVYHNVLASLARVGAAVFYLVAMVGLGFHLWHGLKSMWQSLGWMSAPWVRPERRFAVLFAFLVAAGFASIPLAVVFGFGR